VAEAWINRIGTAVPPHDIHQPFIAAGLSLLEDRARALFERMAGMAGIAHRYAILPAAVSPYSEALDAAGFYRRGAFPSTAARMKLYQAEAPPLAERAVQALGLDEGVGGVTHLVLASCTGFSAPGLEFRLMQALGLPGTTERTLIGFMGCFAAVTALRTARHIVRADPSARVLVVCVELCSLHLQDTRDLSAVLSLLLFGDGAAAALVTADPYGIALGAFGTEVLPDTEGLITWDIGDSGFLMQLSGKVPGQIRRYLGAAGPALLERLGRPDPALWAVHAGGRTILDAVQDGLRLPPHALLPSRGVLRDFGNLSSGTLLFVLHRLLNDSGQSGDGVAMAFGPGLTVESFAFSLG
jgi:predicted naringenin-chalcone synthase